MKKIITILATSLFIITGGYSQNAETILKLSDSVTYAPDDQVNEVRMILTDKKDRTQERSAVGLQMGTDYRLFRFTAPASQEGIAFLSLPDDVMYLYLPAYNKARRIASHIKNQGFAGTDLTYEDMEAVPMHEKYDPTLIEENEKGYLLELVPKPERKSDYSKMVTLVDKENYMILQSDYYDKGGNKVKVMKNDEIENFDGFWIITDLTMTDLKKDHSTRMIFDNVKVNTGLTEDDFSVRKLTR